jgi:ABC transporter with metal-binding/Fe-S-binding domain ATP-binding protein
MKSVSLLSGGKDSFFATVIAMEQGFDVSTCVTVEPKEYSEMFHFPNYVFSKYVAHLLNLNTVFLKENTFYSDLSDFMKKENAKVLISGAIRSNFQKNRLEEFCTKNGYISYTPLWMMDQSLEVNELIKSHIRAIIISTAAEGIDSSYLGREFNEELLDELEKLKNRYGINVSGEGGEYESFVRGFGSKKINIKNYKDIIKGSVSYREILNVEIV